MSYTQLVKKWKRESDKKYKQERKAYKIQKEKEEKFKEAIYIAKGKQEKQERLAQEEKQERVYNSKQEILQAIKQNNPFSYKQFLIIYDIFCYNYDQILSDLQKNKITITDIKTIIEYIETYSKELISNYWKERLLIA